MFFIPIIQLLEIYDKHQKYRKKHKYIHFSKKVVYCGKKGPMFELGRLIQCLLGH